MECLDRNYFTFISTFKSTSVRVRGKMNDPATGERDSGNIINAFIVVQRGHDSSCEGKQEDAERWK